MLNYFDPKIQVLRSHIKPFFKIEETYEYMEVKDYTKVEWLVFSLPISEGIK